jgi:hypothetical protein
MKQIDSQSITSDARQSVRQRYLLASRDRCMSTKRLENTLVDAVSALRTLKQTTREIRPDDPNAQAIRAELGDIVRQVRQGIERVKKVRAEGDAPASEVAEVLAMCEVLERELLKLDER